MTKREIIKKYFEIAERAATEINPQLIKLVEKGKISPGSLYLHMSYEWFGYKAIDEILTKATKSKDYIKYIKRTGLWTLNYYLKDIEDNYNKALEIIKGVN